MFAVLGLLLWWLTALHLIACRMLCERGCLDAHPSRGAVSQCLQLSKTTVYRFQSLNARFDMPGLPRFALAMKRDPIYGHNECEKPLRLQKIRLDTRVERRASSSMRK